MTYPTVRISAIERLLASPYAARRSKLVLSDNFCRVSNLRAVISVSPQIPLSGRVIITILCSFANYLVIFLSIPDRSELADAMELSGDSTHGKKESDAYRERLVTFYEDALL